MQHSNVIQHRLRTLPRGWVYALGMLVLLVALGHARHAVALDAAHLSGDVCEYCTAGGAALVAADVIVVAECAPAAAPVARQVSLVSRAAPTARSRAPPLPLHV